METVSLVSGPVSAQAVPMPNKVSQAMAGRGEAVKEDDEAIMHRTLNKSVALLARCQGGETLTMPLAYVNRSELSYELLSDGLGPLANRLSAHFWFAM